MLLEVWTSQVHGVYMLYMQFSVARRATPSIGERGRHVFCVLKTVLGRNGSNVSGPHEHMIYKSTKHMNLGTLATVLCF